MRIIVLVKYIKYIYAQTGVDPKENYIGPDDIVYIINPLDELAIEEALRIKDKDKDTEVVAISLGNQFAEQGLRRSLSMGVDKAIHIHYEDYEKLDAWVTAMILASSIRNLQFKLIFCGREAVDDHDGLVGPYVGEILKIPYISRVIKIQMDRINNKVFLHRSIERGNREIMECRIPALLTIEKGMNIPRYPTLPGILKAEHQIIEKLDIKHLELLMERIGLASNLTETISFSIPKPKIKVESSENVELSASDRLRLLMKGGDLKKKEGSNVLEGCSDKIFGELERVMKESGTVFE